MNNEGANAFYVKNGFVLQRSYTTSEGRAPLLAGPGSFTTLLSLRAEYAPLNIVLALLLNMVWVFIVLKLTGKVEHVLGRGGIYVIRKFFGVILLAIAARLFTANVTLLIDQFQGVC